jgi:hypothetical protein
MNTCHAYSAKTHVCRCLSALSALSCGAWVLGAGSVSAYAAPQTYATPSRSASSDAQTGFGASAETGVNVLRPFVGAQFGYRFASAPQFELFLDYSYNTAISAFDFHTGGLGAHAYLLTFGSFELYYQGRLSLGISAGGRTNVPERDLGQRLLGAFVTQGLGVDAHLLPSLSIALTLDTGYPVWLRPALAVRYRF